MKTILVTGANGQLGRALQDIQVQFPRWTFHFFDRSQLDITDQAGIHFALRDIEFQYCINAAAFTAVDKAETQQEEAHRVNVLGPKILTDYCLRSNAQLIHISSDYVYDNGLNRPLLEADRTDPKSVYAETKLLGEQEVLNQEDNIVIRTSWVYGLHGNNFIKTVIRLAQERDRLTIVDDQVGAPTNAADLAAAICAIIQSDTKAGGILNYAPSGVASWFDIAQTIVAHKQLNTQVSPIPTRDYPTPAQRPHYSVLNTEKIRKTFNLTVPYWKASLEKFLTQL